MNDRLSFFDPEEQSRWERIRGWLLPDAAELLHQHAKESDPEGKVVEIGSFAGKSTVCLCRGLAASGRGVTAVDLRFQPDFDMNLEGFGYLDRVTKLQGPSLDHFEHWDDPISFLYIDGHHGKGYALADLLLWDWFVMPGGCVALDDTMGFMIGPNLQVQVAIANGAYDFVAEAGGVTFLRKNHSITGLGGTPPSHPVWFAMLHRASAWLGAMDPQLRQPRLPHQPEPVSEWLSRFWHSSPAETLAALKRRFFKARRGGQATSTPSDLDWLEARAPKHADATLNYMRACEQFRAGRLDQACEMMQSSADLNSGDEFLHFTLPISELARLRYAQFKDLKGDREAAIHAYRSLQGSDCPEIRVEAERGIGQPFVQGEAHSRTLLREYSIPWQGRKKHKPRDMALD